jgi:PAS domain S-box-containing protein
MGLSKETLEQLIARSRDVVVSTDVAGRVDYYNDGASLVLGYQAEEIMGERVGGLYPDLDEARRVMKAMRDPGNGGPGIVENFQTTFLSKAGERIPVAISGTILSGPDGKEAGTVGFAKDLRAILRKDQLATLGEVAVGLSHEINNPLAVIVNQAEMLEREIETLAGEHDCSVETERIDAIRREVDRISAIVQRLGEMVETERYETVEYVGPAKMVDLSERREATERDPRLAGLNVLVVDDDLGICRSLKDILEAEGCRVETATDGEEGLRRVEGGGVDLVLSDVVMPRMDGYELYQAIRSMHPSLPILMMTAFHYDRDHIIKRSRMEGLTGVIFKKPVDPQRLRQVILDTLDQKQSR